MAAIRAVWAQAQPSSMRLLETAAEAKALLAQSNRKDQMRSAPAAISLNRAPLKAGICHALQQLWAQSQHSFQTNLSGLMLAQERWEGQSWQGFMWLLPFDHHHSHQSSSSQPQTLLLRYSFFCPNVTYPVHGDISPSSGGELYCIKRNGRSIWHVSLFLFSR